MQGFKSFADKTYLEFGQGVTAVVGPNGSGKSNISDAIRWVLGEMSAKSLRGANMQDVIFSGTQVRKSVNFAEVSLVLDNTDKTFPIEFGEVVVTRRVFRSGETAYQINRANCRLKDIHELFMDTGVGRDGYSIIGQGNVSQILSTKAEDRRSLFEEAAGVSKYKHRKEESQRKLESVNDNLIRINDITIELETQLKPLEQQSEKARKYLALYEEYKSLDINLSLRNIDKYKELMSQTQKQYENVKSELDAINEKAGELEQELASLYDESEKKDQQQSQNNEQLHDNESCRMSTENEISIAKTNIENNTSLEKRIDKEIENIINQNKEREQSISDIQNDILIKESQSKELLDSFDDISDENNNLTDKLNEYKKNIESLKSDVIEMMNSVSAEKAKMNGIDNLRRNFIERKEAVEIEMSTHNTGVENTKHDIDITETALAEKKEKRDKMQGRVDINEKNRKNLLVELEKTKSEFNTLTVEYNSKTSKKRMLEDMENSYDGYALSVKAVLKATELKHLSIYGTLSGLIDVKSDYVTAIETALGGALQNIVVESEEDAKEAIAYLRQRRAGRATFLPVSSVRGRTLDNANQISKCSGFVGLASDLVKYDKKYDGVIKSLLGRVVVFDNIDNGIAVSRQFGYRFRVVTLAGDVLNSGGSMSGGSVNKTGGFLSRVNDIKELGSDISKISVTLRTLKEKGQVIQSDLSNIDNQLSSYKPLVREYEDEILRLENTYTHLKQTLLSSDSTEKTLKSECEEIDIHLKSTSEEIAILINSIREKENNSQTLEEEIFALETSQQEMEIEKEQMNNEVMDKTLKIRSIEKDISVLRESIQSTNKAILDDAQNIESRNRDKDDIKNKNDEYQNQIDIKLKCIEEIDKCIKEIKENIITIEESKQKIIAKQKSIQNANKETTDNLILLQQELTRVEAKKEKISSDEENTINRLWDEYELTYSTAMIYKIDIDDEKAAGKQLSEIKGKIKSLGSVNIDSIEEFKNVKERFEFLTEQKTDLENAKNDLNKIIDSMQELMEDNFSKQFEIINKSFGEVFVELFGGGHGRLYLSNPDDILESGIEIEVQLPGKGLQNISLYSGGEKSFIAIALLFAILNVKPTPFCILDEIDAALDDVNVSRFATYLKNYLSQTQFIVITHRRGTMEAANLMYGVTMQEKGVSKLLSLEIDEVDDDMAN